LPLRLEHQGIPIASVEDWFRHAPPRGGSLQWRDGRSAKELAKAWCAGGGAPAPPSDFLALLASVPVLAALSFDIGYPEHRVRFDEVRGEPRNTDLAVICTGLVGRVALSVEGKVDETFGRAVGEEIMGAAAQWAFEERDGKLDRLRQLAHVILPPRRAGQARIGEIRYQLLTAIAGAWAFAAQSQASIAAFVVHEFLSANVISARIEENGRDLDRIVERVTNGQVRNIALGQLVGPLSVPPSPSWVGVAEWYIGKCRTHLLPGGA
jgi:uncharacterized protein DUF6946